MLQLLLNSSLVRTAYHIAKKERREMFLVGGVLRDLHRTGIISEDIDFLVERDAESIARQFAQSRHGTCFCLDDTRGNYRVILRSNGASHTIDFSPLRGGQIIPDLLNRDFTINSLALKLSDLFERGSCAFIDPTGGITDLKKHLIRVSSPHAFEDDPARLLRAARFSHQCHFTIEPRTEGLIKTAKERLLTCSGERIRNEFFTILHNPDVITALRLLDRLDLLSILLPELDGTKGMPQGTHHSSSLFEHSLRTAYFMETILRKPEHFFPRHKDVLQSHFTRPAEGGVTGRDLAVFIALLHDIGKPSTFMKRDGEIHFYGHERTGSAIARRIARRFRLARKTESIIHKVILHHMRPLQLHLQARITDRARHRLIRDAENAAPYLLILGLADAMATHNECTTDPQLLPIYPVIVDLMDCCFAACSEAREKALLSGYEIMDVLTLKPGKKVGEIIESIKEAERKGLICTKEEALKLITEKNTRN